MGLFESLALGFSVALGWEPLLFCLIGVTLGMVIGVLPGIGAFSAIAMLLPLSFHLSPTPAIIMLAGFYYGAQYGGSTASILLNMPGSPAAAVACLEGYPMARQGKAGVALFMTTVASFVGSTVAILLMAAVSYPLASVAMRFGAPEYASLIVMGLLVASMLVGGSITKGLAMVALGIILGLVGMDNSSAELRYTFGVVGLYDGLSLVAIAMGLLGIPEIVMKLSNRTSLSFVEPDTSLRGMLPSREDAKRSVMPIIRGSGVGSLLGILPGTAPAVASFMSYALERGISKKPEEFGTGRIEGLVAPEAGNNAAAQSAFIPTMSLGIPGDPVMALMMGALLIHGIIPGPRLVVENPDLFWGLIASFWIGNLMLLVLNIPFIGIWVRILKIPYNVLYPLTLILVCVGVYSVRNSAFDILVLMGASLLGCLLIFLRFSPVPLLLGFVLGPMLEQNVTRALMISGGDPGIFLARPISLALLILTLVIIGIVVIGQIRYRRQRRDAPPAAFTTADER